MEGTCYPDIEKKIEEQKRPSDYDRKKYGPKGKKHRHNRE